MHLQLTLQKRCTIIFYRLYLHKKCSVCAMCCAKCTKIVKFVRMAQKIVKISTFMCNKTPCNFNQHLEAL